MSGGETYKKFSPRKCRNKLRKFKHCRDKKWNNYENMQQLNMKLGVYIRGYMWNAHFKFHEFSMHRDADINLSLFSFSEFTTLEEQESRRFDYMKDVDLDEGISTKFISYYLEQYFIYYGFLKFMKRQVQLRDFALVLT
jgi:hypothetical protein